MTAVESLLQQCLAIHGVRAVLVADADGMVVHSATAPHAPVDVEALGAYAAALVKITEPLVEAAHTSRWECIHWEGQNGFGLVMRLGATGLIAVVGADVRYAPVVRISVQDVKNELERLFA
jgi:predicted regulator of Ras-like GTPase activity (Roadblock/LC7/MglB family)